MKKGTLKRIASVVLSAVIMLECTLVNASAASKLAAPSKVTASSITDNSMKLKWSKVTGADAYRVYLWDYDTEKYESAAFVTGTSVTIDELDANTRCKFRVASYDKVNGDYKKQSTSKTYTFKTEKVKLAGPSNIHATKIGDTYFRLTWNTVPGADAYLMFYRVKGTSKWNYIKNGNEKAYITEGAQDVRSFKAGTMYETCIKSYIIEDGKYVEQGTSEIYTLQTRSKLDTMPSHPNIKVKSRSNRIDITWDTYNTIRAVTAYSYIQQWNERSGEWEYIKDANGYKKLFEGYGITFNDLKPNKTYKYKIYTVDKVYEWGKGWTYPVHGCSEVIKVKTPKRSANEWDGSVDTSWYTGNKDSYDISTASQLAGLAELVNNGNIFRNITINLTKDIKLNDTTDWESWTDYAPANRWTPIGGGGGAVSSYKAFSGVFNGNGHTVSGMYVSSYDSAGLFGATVGAYVVNLKLKDSVVHRSDSCIAPVGGIIGKSQNSFIDTCEVNGFIAKGWNDPVLSTRSMGGILGEAGRIDKSATAFGALSLMGGILWNPIIYAAVVDEYKGGTYVNNCLANNVTIYAPDAYAAPVVGTAEEVYINNCLSTNCSIQTNGHNNGAIIALGKGEMKNCYYYNYKMIGENQDQYDKKTVKEVNEKTLTSSSFAKTLGSAFEYSKGNAPKLK